MLLRGAGSGTSPTVREGSLALAVGALPYGRANAPPSRALGQQNCPTPVIGEGSSKLLRGPTQSLRHFILGLLRTHQPLIEPADDVLKPLNAVPGLS